MKFILGVQIKSERFLMEVIVIESILTTNVNSQNIHHHYPELFAIYLAGDERPRNRSLTLSERIGLFNMT